MLDLALEHGILLKRGSWFSYNGEQLGQGRDATKEAIKANQTLYTEIESAVKNAMNGNGESEEESIEFWIGPHSPLRERQPLKGSRSFFIYNFWNTCIF